ncbi:MAG: hypothetical protein K6G09_02945, partial [Treponema sp.]|nr:hypothetical protein [Treponema sp.]
DEELKLPLTIEDFMEIAEEEIERTSKEAVKAALIEVGGELAYQTELANEYEKKNADLIFENMELKNSIKKNKWKSFNGFCAGFAAGTVLSGFIFSVCR